MSYSLYYYTIVLIDWQILLPLLLLIHQGKAGVVGVLACLCAMGLERSGLDAHAFEGDTRLTNGLVECSSEYAVVASASEVE